MRPELHATSRGRLFGHSGSKLSIEWTCPADTISSLGDRKSDLDANQLDHETSFSSFSKEFKNKVHGGQIVLKVCQTRKFLWASYTPQDLYGLQFHPESIATCHGSQIFKNFREITEDFWGGKDTFFISEGKVQYNGELQIKTNQLLTFLIHTQVASGGKLYLSLTHAGEKWKLAVQKQPRSNYLPILDTNHFNMYKMVNSSNLTNGVKFLKLKWRKLEHLSCQVGGVNNIFLEMFGDEKVGNTFWLDTSS
ncbi:Glutamine amidotransferase type 1, partial [Cynara cardunculus var. scolymus]